MLQLAPLPVTINRGIATSCDSDLCWFKTRYLYFNGSKISFAGTNSVTKWIKSCLLQCFGTFKIPILMFISVLVFRPEGQIWNPVRRDTRIYVRRILNASRISKTQLNSCTISPS